MRNYEQLLSNYDFILNLLEVGFSIKQIIPEINSQLGIYVTYSELLYLIKKVKSNTIHKEYDSIVMIDSIKDAWDANLDKYCVDFHGLLITYKSAARFTNPEFIINQDNLLTISDNEAVLYAKRILKLYHIPDATLLHQHKLKYQQQPDINLIAFMDKIYAGFNDDFNKMLADLRKKYVHFITNGLKELTNEKANGL